MCKGNIIDMKYLWLNDDSKTFLQRGYLTEGVTPEKRIKNIAKAAEKLLNKPGFAEKFDEYMAKGWYSLSSPVWANFGLERGLPISCFGSYVGDTLESILTKNAEAGMMTKMGGGTSAYFGDIRPRGATISTGGKSSGPVHFMELFETMTNVVSQSNVRRGSFAGYMDVEHPDILEFLQIKSEGHPIQNMSIGVTISDKWMKEMVDGDSAKRKIWGKIIQKRFESGYPYIMFSDTMNKNAPAVYKKHGKRIHASNLCFTGDTLIEIATYADGSDATFIKLDEFTRCFNLGIWKEVYTRSWNLDKTQFTWERVSAAAQTGTATELIEIETPDGNKLECTPEHLILTKNRGWVQAQHLEETDELISQK